jgi:hypothetical protein
VQVDRSRSRARERVERFASASGYRGRYDGYP